MRGRTLSLKKSAFLRLVAITFAAVLIFYVIGVYINALGIRNVRQDMARALESDTEYIAEELRSDFDTLSFFMIELMSDKQLMRYVIASDIMQDYERLTYIKALSAQEYMIKRASPLAEQVQVMLPNQGRTIITDQTLYLDLDYEAWENLIAGTEKNRVTTVEWNGRLWLLLPRYEGDRPLFMIAISILPETLMQRLMEIGNERIDGMQLLRQDGTPLAVGGDGEALSRASEKRVFHAQHEDSRTGCVLRCYRRVDESLSPFVNYRLALWLLTLLAIVLLAAYLLYYRVFILRPLNDIFDTMRQSEKDGRFRVVRTRGTDYDDIYARFNDMVAHIEELAGQVYEEQYRAQKAELKQLQMQIDPHFLYNSLYLIYRIARSEGNESIARLSLNLSNYYRYITKMPEHVVPLREEINHVMNYLEIQSVRFEPRVHIETEPLPEEIAEERIPSLIIQPVVENAFQHGVKDVASGGVVSLRYRVLPDSFQVIVADNSGKMDEEHVRLLWERLKSDDAGDSNALRNLYRRLQLYQGGEHSLELRSVSNGLTAVLTFRKGQNHEKLADR